MIQLIIRRLLGLPIVLLGVTLMIVGLMQLLPARQRATAFVKNAAQMRNLDGIVKEKGLDKPFISQYLSWMGNVLGGNYGYSKSSEQTVLETIKQRFPATLELSLYAGVLTIGAGIWLGTRAALRQGEAIDRLIRSFTLLSWNTPSYILSIWLLLLFYGTLGILPGFGQLGSSNAISMITNPPMRYTGLLTIDSLLGGHWTTWLDAVTHLILPVCALTISNVGNIVAVMRGSLLEVLPLEFITAARARGLSQKQVNLKHARTNALIPVLTLSGGTVTGMLTGAIFIESIFGLPGIGSWGANAAQTLDYAGILGFTAFTALIVVVGNLITDLSYAFVDPRVRFE